MSAPARHTVFRVLRALWRAARRVLPRIWIRRLEGSRGAQRLRRSIGPSKYEAELGFWRDQYEKSGGVLRDDRYYETLIRRVADLGSDTPFRNKIVVDIGCGPRGSLCWVRGARLRVGVDPLAAAYRALGSAAHPMVYLAGLAETLPLPDGSVDVLLTINALDHVDDPIRAMREMRRVLRPGGLFIGSINLRERPTGTEPAVLSEDLVRAHLLRDWVVEYELVFPECDAPDDAYRYADTPAPPGYVAEMNILWCRARRPACPDC